ncbi:MAG: DUF4249 domain-containing protein [Odoribacteraceae bacterium]|jgi:hypothetical protein|nr:DUF4249 domain-containing protein [Odoribacteraceae bacterium]
MNTARLLLPALLLAACTARVDIRLDESAPAIVIHGYITTDTARHPVTISRSTAYFAVTPPPPVRGATVTISRGHDTFPFVEDDTLPGTYRPVTPIACTPGATYTLAVTVSENGTPATYTASSTAPLDSEIDSIELRPSTVFKNSVEVLGHGTLPDNEKNFLSFHLYRDGLHLTSRLEDLFIVDDSYFKQKEMHGVLCQLLDQETPATTLSPGDVVTLRVDVLPEDYARFLQQARQQARGSNPIFSGPPANISTNITRVSPAADTSPVAGFFAAFPTRKKSAVYAPLP